MFYKIEDELLEILINAILDSHSSKYTSREMIGLVNALKKLEPITQVDVNKTEESEHKK